MEDKADLDYDQEIERVKNEMDSTEDKLIESGFPEEQWMLIKRYIFSATHLNQLVIGKGYQDASVKSDLTEPS